VRFVPFGPGLIPLGKEKKRLVLASTRELTVLFSRQGKGEFEQKKKEKPLTARKEEMC